MIAPLMFLVGLAVGAVVNAKWADLVELLDIYRNERE